MRLRTALLGVALLLLGTVAGATTADLQQTVSDLKSQTDDKERMDVLGSSKVEISEIRTWLAGAANAIQEEDEAKCRRIFERARLQLKLVDQQIALAKLEADARKLEEAVAQAKRRNARTKKKLQDKQAMLRALKMRDR